MTRDLDFDQIAKEWLNDGSDRTPPPLIDAVLLAVRTTPQERDLRTSRRTLSMRNPLYTAAVIAVLVVAGVGALYAFPPRFDAGLGAMPSSAVQPTEPPSPTAIPSESPPVNLPSGWTAYTSAQYGFTIGHPADWSVQPAKRAWTLATDADDWLSTGQEMFVSPDGHVRVSAWSVAPDPDRPPIWVDPQTQAWANVAAWVEDYCRAAGNSPCEGIIDRAVPLCLERRDCHPGLIVPFKSDVQAFFTNGGAGADMVVVAVWWGESAPAVASYGGSHRLLEAFLSTMCVWPADARPPFGEAIPGC